MGPGLEQVGVQLHTSKFLKLKTNIRGNLFKSSLRTHASRYRFPLSMVSKTWEVTDLLESRGNQIMCVT